MRSPYKVGIHDIAVAMVGMVFVVESLRVESALRNLTADIPWVTKKFPELGRAVDTTGEVASAPNNGDGLIRWSSCG